MNGSLIRRHFARIGTEIQIEAVQEPRARRRLPDVDYSIDVTGNNRNENFLLLVREEAIRNYQFLAVDIRPADRHLLLMSRRLDTNEKRKFLCGHDERHWFVAGIPKESSVANVAQAMEALKPLDAQFSQRKARVKRKSWNRRHNAGFIRQGEWFFIPYPEFSPSKHGVILKNEPLRRGGGKAHMVQEIYRTGGQTVYVCQQHPNGLRTFEYEKLLRSRPEARKWYWHVMALNPTVYARGTVRHADHQTIVLPFWHQVRLSNEGNDGAVAFLD